MSRSVLDAIKDGDWDFEPAEQDCPQPASSAMPGTAEKLSILASRLRLGLPLWNPEDRRSYDDAETGK